MRKSILALAVASLAAGFVAGCGDKPSTPIAPDVKEPNTSGMSKEDILRMKQGGEPTKP